MFKDDNIRIRHILDAAREGVDFAEGRCREDLDTDRKLNLSLVRLLEIVGFQVTDIGLQNLAMANGENTESDIRAHAAEWIDVNRRIVDAWLNEARKFASG